MDTSSGAFFVSKDPPSTHLPTDRIFLGDIDPEYFTGELPEGPRHTGQCVSKWQNRELHLSHIV